MNRSIEQALTNLIPRHNGSLPPELMNLASSLLAQSQHKASNLKADEEIGRTYACANIACERLKTTLNLPEIEQRPPIPPRVYQKLYAYFDGLLTGGRKRGRPRLSSTHTPSKKQRTSTAGTIQPGSARSISQFQTRAPKKSLLVSNNEDRRAQIPRWIVPTIRLLCKKLELRRAYPHILAGVESVLTLPCPVTEANKQGAAKKLEGKTPALLAAVYMFVRTRLLSTQTTGKEYNQQRKIVLGVLARAGEEVEKVEAADVDAWLFELSENGWLDMDWFQEIEEGSAAEGDDAVADDEFWSEKKVANRGLGTMMQDKVDYLSEENRAQYKVWKAIMVAKIDELMSARQLGLEEEDEPSEHHSRGEIDDSDGQVTEEFMEENTEEATEEVMGEDMEEITEEVTEETTEEITEGVIGEATREITHEVTDEVMEEA